MDKLTPERRRANMRAIRSKDMKPELLVRSLVHRLGYRFRLHRNDLPGKPDIVLPRLRKVILVHGCFWHQHPTSSCNDARVPKSNRSYWVEKLARNAQRDKRNLTLLKRAGWSVLVVWECQTKDKTRLANKLSRFLEGPA